MSDQSGLFCSSSHFVLRLYARPYTKIFIKRHLRCLSRSAVFCHWTTIINGSSILTSLLMCLETADISRLCYSLGSKCFLQGHILYYICTRGHTQKNILSLLFLISQAATQKCSQLWIGQQMRCLGQRGRINNTSPWIINNDSIPPNCDIAQCLSQS